MRVELPQFKKCCCCIPLRYGLLVWGYIKLLACLLNLFAFTVLCVKSHIYDLLQVFIITLIALALALDTSFTLIFIIGAHKKNVKLLRIYYIATIVTVVIIVLLSLAYFILRIIQYEQLREYYGETGPELIQSLYEYLFMEAVVAFLNICIQCYLLLLVRSEVIKLQAKCRFEFVNNATESECRMNIEDTEVV